MTHVYRALFLVALFAAAPFVASASGGNYGNYNYNYHYSNRVVTTPYWCGTYWSSLPCQQMYYQPVNYYNPYSYQYQYPNYYSYDNQVRVWNRNSDRDYDRDRDHDRDRDDDDRRDSRNKHWWDR